MSKEPCRNSFPLVSYDCIGWHTVNRTFEVLDYFKDEQAFLQRVEEDATAFQPVGQKIHSYTRPSGKGKSKQKLGTVDDDDDIDIELFEWEHRKDYGFEPTKLPMKWAEGLCMHLLIIGI